MPGTGRRGWRKRCVQLLLIAATCLHACAAGARATPVMGSMLDVSTSPLSDSQRAVTAAGLADRVTYLKHGERYHFAKRP